MTNPQLGVLMLCLLVPAIFLGFPTVFTLLALGFFFGYIGFGHFVFDLMVTRAYQVMSTDVLVAVPLFIFMGYVLERSGVLDRLFRAIQIAMGPIRGSLALATLATCTIFATATGIIGASVTLTQICWGMIPLRRDERTTLGLTRDAPFPNR